MLNRKRENRGLPTKLAQVSDAAELIAKAKVGDRVALESLLRSQLPLVYRYLAVKMGREHPDLEDVVQEVLISAAGSIGSLRAEHDGSVPKWFIAIANHKVADHRRRSMARPLVSLDGAVPMDSAVAAVDVEEVVSQRFRDRRVRQAMRELTSEQEEVLVLRFVLGFEGPQVAAITGRTLGAVKALQHRGLSSLQKLLAGQVELA
jgi:RNA polymerase sigma-70 factor (ECF subfamily)